MNNLFTLGVLLLITPTIYSCSTSEESTTTLPQTEEPNSATGHETISWGRSLASIEENDYTLSYTFDEEGRVIESIEESGDKYSLTTYTYNEDGSMSYESPNGTLYSSQATRIEAEFNDLGLITKEVVRTLNDSASLIETRTYIYNEDCYLTKAIQKASSYTNTFTYEWENGNLITINNLFYFSSFQYTIKDVVSYTYGDIQANEITYNPMFIMSDDRPVTPTVWYGKGSALLPTFRKINSFNNNIGNSFVIPTSTSTLSYDYTLNADGFITSITSTDQDNNEGVMTFRYQE